MMRSLFNPYLAKTAGAAATMPSTSPGTLLLPFGHIACMISSVSIISLLCAFGEAWEPINQTGNHPLTVAPAPHCEACYQGRAYSKISSPISKQEVAGEL